MTETEKPTLPFRETPMDKKYGLSGKAQMTRFELLTGDWRAIFKLL
jgi:hypothetical protein